MPFRDHFRPPISTRHSWEGFHAQWPAMLVSRLSAQLPEAYTAEPRVHLGAFYEIDVGTFETGTPEPTAGENGGVAVRPYTAPQPTLTVEADLGQQYEYEVQVFDQTRDRQLVAAVEFVSPANKDRPEHRRAFVAKCAALLQKGVCVTMVDPVTNRRANLYAELLELIDRADPTFGADPPVTYAVTCRTRTAGRSPKLDNWAYPLEIGRALPTLPLWLPDGEVGLELEGSYEDTCRILRIA